MSNLVMFTVYDTTAEQFELTKKAFASIMEQDIPVEVYVLDNGSTWPQTYYWLQHDVMSKPNCRWIRHESNQSPIKLHNSLLGWIFNEHEYVLSVPNDVMLPPNTYRKMLERPEQMVAANMDGTNPPVLMEDVKRIHGDLHMAVMMTRKSAYDALVEKDGYFMDEGFFLYASDCDLKLRILKAVISTAQLDIQCWHYGSASHRLGAKGNGAFGADSDRAYFTRKWGFPIGSDPYNRFVSKLSC